jgi:hypothetical protein
MVNTIQIKRSNVAGKVPTAASLEVGELALNFPDKKIYTKEPGGAVIEMTPSRVIDVNDAQPGLRITQAGSGAALLVEDEANPDASPFVVDTSGNVGVGMAAPTAKLHVSGPTVIDVSDATKPALFVRQTGAGDAFVVADDAASPDLSPFVVTAQGDTGIGIKTPAAKLHVQGKSTAGIIDNINDFSTLHIDGSLANAGMTGLTFADGGGGGAAVGMGRGTGFDTYVAFYTNPQNNGVSGATTERMRVDHLGNVGIGTMGPSCRLHVDGGTADEVFRINSPGSPYISIYRANAREFYLQATASAIYQVVEQSKPLIWQANAYGEAMRVHTNGRIGLSAQDPQAKLHVVTTDNSVSSLFVGGYNSAPASKWQTNGTGGVKALSFLTSAGSEVGYISQGPTSVTYSTTSDYRLKEDLRPVANPLQRVMMLKPVNFAWKVNGERVDGFIAHEAQEVVPDAVFGKKDAVNEDGSIEPQGIDQSKLVPLLTAALQEALKRIEALEARP